MGYAFIGPRTEYRESSGTISMTFKIGGSSYNSFTVTKNSTGSFSGIRLEAANYDPGGGNSPPTANRYWATVDEFTTEYSGSIMTGSASGASRVYNIANLNTLFARVVIDVGQADIFTISWHGKPG